MFALEINWIHFSGKFLIPLEGKTLCVCASVLRLVCGISNLHPAGVQFPAVGNATQFCAVAYNNWCGIILLCDDERLDNAVDEANNNNSLAVQPFSYSRSFSI